jgi:hypothetical protein
MSYVTKVADLIIARCQGEMILDPAIYTAIAEWEKQEIPLAIVFDSINRVFDNSAQNNAPLNIKSFSRLQNEIKTGFAAGLQNSLNVR